MGQTENHQVKNRYRLFQNRGPAMANERSPTVTHCQISL